MLQKTTIEGRPAMVAFLNEKFEPVARDAATLLKAVFTDERGGVAFMTRGDDAPQKSLAPIKAEVLIAAKRSGIDTRNVIFSNKLEWVARDGAPVLRQARIDRVSGKVTLFVEAMRARWGGQELERQTLDVLGRCIGALQRRAPETLYVHRPLLNADEVIAWAKAEGFATTLLPGDMHVTIAHSSKPLDWDKAGTSAAEIVIPAGSSGRRVEKLGEDGAVVLRFESEALQQRWQEFRDAGASWDWPTFKPHVTLTYKGAPRARPAPYTGRLVFGAEVFEKLSPVGDHAERDFTFAPVEPRYWDEDEHPRHPAGTSEGGQFAPKGEGGGGPTEQPTPEEISDALAAQAEPPKPTGPYKITAQDFAKAGVGINAEGARIDQFIDKWSERVPSKTPEEFRKGFTGSEHSTMVITPQVGGTWIVQGSVKDSHGKTVGNYKREIDWARKKAKSDYFSLDSRETGKDIGKKLLAGNIETYRSLGIEKVDVYANLDVGGYAWAKYGYVPTAASWSELQVSLLNKLDGGGRSGRSSMYTPEEWDSIGDHDQRQIQHRWMRETYDEFFDSEIQNWQESGGRLDESKHIVADNFGVSEDWPHETLRPLLAQHNIPYTTDQIVDALSVDYERDGEGRNDPDWTFDDSKLRNPSNAPPPGQLDLPGFDPIDLSSYLTEDMRTAITDALTKAFNDKAEADEDEIEPPSYLGDSVSEYQEEYWSSMESRERYDAAVRYGLLPEYEIEDEDGDGEPVEAEDDERTDLIDLLNSHDPKTIWQVADSPLGKRLLLKEEWNGVLDLKDPEAMARFSAYVGKGKGK